MGNKTKISWVKNGDGSSGKTWNPMAGCSKLSAGCKNCYGLRLISRFAGLKGWPSDPSGKVELFPKRLDQPYKWRPTDVFVCSTGDLFHDDVPTKYIEDVYKVMIENSQHTFKVLTKRPKRMLEVYNEIILDGHSIGSLSHIYHGVSVEDSNNVYRIDVLRDVRSTVKFVSFEPLLERFGFSNLDLSDIDWVIIGGESGVGARAIDLNCARGLIDVADKYGCKVFFKQMGAKWAAFHGSRSNNGDIVGELPLWARRQEFI